MLVLGVHSGWQDAGAAVFDGARLLAAMPLARLSGVSHDGGRLPVEAIGECLDIANLRAGDIAGLALSQGLFPGRHFRALSLPRRVGRGLRSLLGRDTPISLPDEARKHHRSNPESLLDLGLLAGDLGLNRHVQTRLYGSHEAYALLALADAPWADDTLVFTADLTGCAARVLKFGRIATLYEDGADGSAIQDAPAGDTPGGDTLGGDTLGRLASLAIDGLGLPDISALFALGLQGEPVFAEAFKAHVTVDMQGRILVDFSKEGGAARWLRRLAEGQPPALLAASLGLLLADRIAEAIALVLDKHNLRRVALAGPLLADPVLLMQLQARLGDGVAVAAQLADESALPLGGALGLLLQQDGLEAFLRQRRPLRDAAWGRDYTGDLDPVLGNAGCRMVSRDPLRAAAALLNAGKVIAICEGRGLGATGGPNRLALFAASQADLPAQVNARFDRPSFSMPVLHASRTALAELLPDWRDPAIAAMLAARWAPQLPAATRQPLRAEIVDELRHPLLSGLIEHYKALCWLPALLGLPLQIGSEPPLDSPSDMLRLLREGRVDYIVTDQAVWERG
jgi:predicted NodU family carbamoyl transferase